VRYSILFLAVSLCAAGPPARFAEHVVATGLKGGYQVVAADVNRDGRPDLIALASGMPDLVWFENPGWERHVIAAGQKRMINLAVVDGAIVLASEFAMEAKDSIGLVSVLTPDGDPRRPWKMREIDRLPTSHRLRTMRLEGRALVVNAPLTAATAGGPEYRGRAPLVYYRQGEWKRRPVSEENEGVQHGLWVLDWDGDGNDDILTASFSGIHLFQFQAGRWKRAKLTGGSPAPWPKCGSSDVAVGRIGNQRFLCAIEPWHGNEVAVYRGSAWERRVIDSTLVDGHTIVTADLNGDGNDEIIAGFRGQGRSVYIYYPEDWRREILDKGGMAAAACAAADLNGDGRIDVACIGSATANLKWYENLK
jgi:hypothetical protein